MDDNPVTSYKFMIPGSESRILTRPRLLRMLDSFGALPWTTVIAPTGYGKTTTVASWARDHSHLVWYTLEASDNDPLVFSRRMTQALQKLGRSIGGALTSTPIEVILDLLRNRDAEITIVLDDVHVITNQDAWDIVRSLVAAGSSRIHIVLIGQSISQLDLDLIRLRGQLGEIGVADLAMPEDEARAFLLLGSRTAISPEETRLIVDSADGWVAGLKMALIGHEGRGSSSEYMGTAWDWGRPFAVLFDRLAGQWSEPFLRFLVSVSLPSRISGKLISTLDLEWLNGKDPDLVLRELSDAGLFLVPLTAQATWYRFQGLFRDELVRRASQLLSDTEIREIYVRAAHWHLEREDISEAIDHLLLADCLPEASQLVRVAAPRALVLDQWRDVAQWLQRLGAPTVDADAELLMCRAWVAQIEGQHEILRGVIEHARTLLHESGLAYSDEILDRFESELDMIEVMTQLTGSVGDERVLVYEHAFTQLYGMGSLGEMMSIQYHLTHLSQAHPEEAKRTADRIIMANANNDDAIAQIRVLWARVGQLFAHGATGEMHQLLDMSQSILTLAQSIDARRQIAHGHFLVGSAFLELDHLTEAEKHFRTAWHMPEASIRVWVGSAARLARTLDAQGRFDEADVIVQTCLDRLLEHQAVPFVRYLRTVETSILFGRNQPFKSSQLVWALEETDPQYAATEIENPMFVRALVLSGSDLPEHEAIADKVLDELLAHPEWLHWLGSRIQLTLLEAFRYYRHQEYANASRLLVEAVEMAEQAGYVRVFCGLGQGVEAMLFWFQSHHRHWPYLADVIERLQAHRVRLERYQHSVSAHTPPTPIAMDSTVVASLSPRELDVLDGLCQRYSDKEIAAILCIAPTTVKSHTQSIYQKLGVNSRRQAIAKVTGVDLVSTRRSSLS